MFVALLSCRHSTKLVLIFNKILVADLITSYLESDVDVDQDFELDFSDDLEDGEERYSEFEETEKSWSDIFEQTETSSSGYKPSQPPSQPHFEEVEIEYKRKVVSYWRSGKKKKNLDNVLKKDFRV